MLRHLFFYISLGLIWSGAYAQKNSTEGHIFWSEERRLTWDDFQARPKKNHFASAMSDVAFSIKVESDGKLLKVYVRPSFDPQGSWVNKDEADSFLLQHEQVHFDIYEVNARKLRQELKTKRLTPNNSENVINRLIEKYSKLNVDVQNDYDDETDHSLKKEKQIKWNEKIAEELDELKEFGDAEFEVELE